MIMALKCRRPLLLQVSPTPFTRWNPAFEAGSDEVARLGGGERVVVRSEHHFPHLVSEEFNDRLNAFMTQSERA